MHNEMNCDALGRRAFLQSSGIGIGSMALTVLLNADRQANAAKRGQRFDMSAKPGHFKPRAKSVIFLMQNGGPSQMDLFDRKPELQRRGGQRHPVKFISFQPGSTPNKLMASPFKFRRYGDSGREMSVLLPHIGSLADDMCLIRSMYSDNNNHPQALRCINTGKIFTGRPTLGAWISYALGTENQNLPAFVALRDPNGYNSGGTTLWTNGWLPALYRGTEIRSEGAPVLNLLSSVKVPTEARENQLDLIARLNERHRRRFSDNLELESRIRNYELAARMQLHARQTLDTDRETDATRRMYGLDNGETKNYGTRLLMARRLIESGVRFVQVTSPVKGGSMPWDNHSNIPTGLPSICKQVDKPTAGLIQDLKQRGLLNDTIVIWSGEFGRLPISQHAVGRDHNQFAFSLMVFGGGFKPGIDYGATDEFGYRSVQKRVSCPDFLATILHQLGLDHDELSYRHNGRDETLTDSAVTNASVVHDVLA